MEPLLVLTIGQSPRPDIAAELAEVLGERPVEVRGALDGDSDAAIATLAPLDAADTLHTRIRTGHDVVVSKAAVAARLTNLLNGAGGRPALVACTGRFSGLPQRPGVLYPSVVLAGVVDAVLPSGGHLGALVPLEVQVEPFAQAWATPQRRATVAAVKPDANPGPAARRLAEAGAQLIVLDCFGYHRGTLDAVRRASGLPVLSAVRCTAHLAAELAG